MPGHSCGTTVTITTELILRLKRLKLGATLITLLERIAVARREQLDYASFLMGSTSAVRFGVCGIFTKGSLVHYEDSNCLGPLSVHSPQVHSP